ncbi:MAG: NUDIX domain-containing protein, partial [Candidatus Sungbacteria bacterium]|nr:NUDIX domain-containing protein [Candidatus Sungbacteria bacterium]
METHFSAVIVARERGGRPEVLVQPYMWRGRLQQKFPGGMGEEGESPADTAVREARQEVSL